MAKAETKTRNKPRPTAAVQAFKKKYQEQRLAKQKISLTKLAQKGKFVICFSCKYCCTIQ